MAEVVEEERAGEDRGGRVGLLLAGDVGGGAVDRLEHGGRRPVGVTLPEAASPIPPVMAAARSVMMSPKRLSVTITSKRAGSVTMKIMAASMWM